MTERQLDQVWLEASRAEYERRTGCDAVEAGGCAPPVLALRPEWTLHDDIVRPDGTVPEIDRTPIPGWTSGC